MFKLNNAAQEYGKLISGDDTIPQEIRTLSGVSLDDQDLMAQTILPRFRKKKALIDFYLRNTVFPRGAKEFEKKLSSAGWDLAEHDRKHPITGFSGTNDNRFLLPVSVQQKDLTENLGTNAKVLGYLLQQENDFYASVPAGTDKFEALLSQILLQEEK